MTENLFDDPGAVEALRQKGAGSIPPPPNPYFDDEPTPPPEAENEDPEDPWAPRQASREEPEEPERKEGQAPTPSPASQPPPAQGQPVLQMNPNEMAQAIAWALQSQQQPSGPKAPEWEDPPEIEVDDDAILESRQSLRKVLRDVQTQTARHTREQVLRQIQPEIERGHQLAQFVYSTLPNQEYAARGAARDALVRQGFGSQAEIDFLLDEAAPYIQQSWDYRLNPQGWIAAAQFARMARNPGAMPAENPPKRAPGAGKGDPGAAPRRRDAAPSNPHLAEVARRNGKPLSADRLQEWKERTGHAR